MDYTDRYIFVMKLKQMLKSEQTKTLIIEKNGAVNGQRNSSYKGEINLPNHGHESLKEYIESLK